MKNLKITCLLILIISACSPKVSNTNIDKFEMQQQVLKKTTELNNLKLKLERELLENKELISKVENINKDATASADDAKSQAVRVSGNPGDAGISRKADIAAKKAAKDASRGRELNSDLEKSGKEIKDLEKKIRELEIEVNDMKAKIEFVPNQDTTKN